MRRAPRWPGPPTHPSDPFADEPILLPGDPPTAQIDLGWEDYQSAIRALPDGPSLSPERYAAEASELLAWLEASERGEPPPPEALRARLQRLRISTALQNDSRTEPIAPETVPSDADLARVATDMCPAAAAEAADRVLGPLAAELDARSPAHHRALQAALAAFALIPPDGDARQSGVRADQVAPGLPPLVRWSRRKPIPSVAARRAFRAIARAPWVPWRILREHDDGTVTLSPLVPLDPRWLPQGPVPLDAGAPIRAPRAGDLVMARVVHSPSGPMLRTPLAFPAGPPPTRIVHWLRAELIRTRLYRREATVECALRERGYALARRLCEWAWLHGDDDPYALPDLYDLEYRDHDEDIDWYRDLAARYGGPVLEMGCGSGRLTLAIAQHGIAVHGVDRSQPMLDQLEAKRQALDPAVAGRIRLFQGDFRHHRAPPVHPLVLLPFNALHHCADLDEVVQAFRRAREALAPGGRVAFDCYLPDVELYDRDPDQRYEPRRFVHPVTGEVVDSWEQGWWDPQSQVHHVLYVYVRADGSRSHAHLQLRMFQRAEIYEAVERAGLRFIARHRDFEARPLTSRSLKLVALTEPIDAP